MSNIARDNNEYKYFNNQDEILNFVLSDMARQDEDVIPILSGPTASGKSSIALRWCEQEGRELISADSMQIYRGFDIGTAKPSQAEQERVRHHLIDIKDSDEWYSVAQFVEDASRILKSAENSAEKKHFLICGGSGQYISALVEGLEFTDQGPTDQLRKKVETKVQEMGQEKAYQILEQLDPEAAKNIDVENTRRITRFFERYEATGKTLSELNRESRLKGPDFRFRVYQLLWQNRQDLYDRINKRTEMMFAAGLVEETKKLMQNSQDPESEPAFRGIGYKQSLQYLKGELSGELLIEKTATATRHYAKRQLTWFRPKDYLIRLVHK